jgi:hypothetical protein
MIGMMQQMSDYRLAVRYAERTVPGVRHLLQDSQNGPAELLDYVVDQYVAMTEQCIDLKRRCVPVLCRIKGEEEK